MWGFITVMNDVLINSFGDLFHLEPSELSYIQLSFFGTFFFVSLIYFVISSKTENDPINRLGYKNGMGVSLIICALGCSTFFIAGQNESYAQFIVALFILSIGVTLLQICANPYVAILGTESGASSRLNLAQGLNSLGTTLGPIVGNILIYSVFSSGQKSIASVGSTYLLYGGIFLILAIITIMSKMPAFQNDQVTRGGLGIFKNRNLKFGVLAIFFYVGAEVSIGSWIGTFAKDKTILGLDEQSANYFLSFFWGGLMIGRLMASISLSDTLTNTKKYIGMALTSIVVFFIIWLATSVRVETNSGLQLSFDPLPLSSISYYLLFMLLNFFAFVFGKGIPQRLLVIFCSINVLLISIGILTTGELAFWAILGTGLFFSIGWSNIFTLSIKGLGSSTSQGSSLLIMAIVGGAILPFFQSKIIEVSDVQTSFIIPLIALIYLIFFGISGYKRNALENE